jgi:hypothetical protein
LALDKTPLRNQPLLLRDDFEQPRQDVDLALAQAVLINAHLRVQGAFRRGQLQLGALELLREAFGGRIHQVEVVERQLEDLAQLLDRQLGYLLEA